MGLFYNIIYLCLMVCHDNVSLVCFTTLYICVSWYVMIMSYGSVLQHYISVSHGLFYNIIYLCLMVCHDNVSLVCFTTLYICVSWYVMIMSHWSVLQHYISVSHGLFYNIIYLCLMVCHDNVSLVCFTTLYICVSWYVMIMSHWSVLQHYISMSHGMS